MHASVAFGKKLVVDLVPSPDLEKTTMKEVHTYLVNFIHASALFLKTLKHNLCFYRTELIRIQGCVDVTEGLLNIFFFFKC